MDLRVNKIKDVINRKIEECESKYPKDKGGYWSDEESDAFVIAEEYKKLLLFINSLQVEKKPSEDLEKLIQNLTDKYPINKDALPEQSLNDYYQGLRFGVLQGAQWQKEQMMKLLKTLYSDCDSLKKDLDKVTTGNLSHRIGNIKFSITGMQVFIKKEIGDE